MDVRSHRFISHFPKAPGARLSRQIRLVRVPHKTVIFKEGSKSDSIYLVLSGRVALMKKTPGGGQQLIAFKGPDDYFGELGVLDGSVRSTSAVADGPVYLGRLPQRPFLKVLSESSWHTVLRLFSQVSENLRATNARFVSEVVRKEKITLIGEMANGMIHDFRSPFATIRLGTELIAKNNPDPQAQEVCKMILRQVVRLGGMVEEVLDFARGETRIHVKPTPLREVFDQLQESNAEVYSKSPVKLEIAATNLILPLDGDRFLRVLQNLVTNGREAISTRSDGEIKVGVRRAGKQCVVTVTDNGPGIPKEIRSTLFEPFVSHGKSGGTGLGLAIAKSVVTAHRGSIDYTTSRKGTKFTIALPADP